ncbi:MAG TPA: DUF3619 family protein [Aquabacterium sp.]|uniref:DUF3619 family protein n=1 Tax=Aquabacterium sp. TaxID=1872578 RepID=UPI002E347AB1|nr:DUF3619 family protein [Aquabacterium sp.]HEX5372017.1 DUF3619 family protein [Aquabacterium sp.]
MNTSKPDSLTAAQAEALSARFALRVSARLNEGTEQLPHDISERLRVARQQAVAAAQLARAGVLARPAAQAATVVVTGPQPALAGAGRGAGMTLPIPHAPASRTHRQHGRDVLHGRRLDEAPPTWGWRLASALPVLALVVGLWLIHKTYQQEQVQAATEVDMALLTDELPPSAYADPGFEEYLRSADAPAIDTGHAEDQDAIEESSDLLPSIDADTPEAVPGSAMPARP